MIHKSLSTLALLILAPMGLSAQQPAADSANSSGSNPYGNGEKRALSYSGQSFLQNILIVDSGVETGYDDNIVGSSKGRHGDVSYRVSPRIGFRRQGRQLTLAFDYQPSFLVYQKTQAYNAWDQGLHLDLSYQLDPRWVVRARAALIYRRDLFQPHASDEFLPGLSGPGSLNQTLFTPLARQFQENARFDVGYQVSVRTSLAVFAGLGVNRFGLPAGGGQNLLNSRMETGGLLYRYRFSPRDELAITDFIENIHFQSKERDVAHSTLLSFARQISPSLTVNLFAGPQYTRVYDRSAAELPLLTAQPRAFRDQWHWALGVELTKQLNRTAFQISGQRQVSDGGGLLGLVISSFLNLSVQQRLWHRWEVRGSIGYATNAALASSVFSGKIHDWTAGAGLGRALTNKLSARAGYEYIRQEGSGASLAQAGIAHNRVYFSLFYRFSEMRLGR